MITCSFWQGVEHNWLVQRLMPTGIFKSNQLCNAYCKFPHSDGHFHAAIGTPTENSPDSGFLTQHFSHHLLGLNFSLFYEVLDENFSNGGTLPRTIFSYSFVPICTSVTASWKWAPSPSPLSPYCFNPFMQEVTKAA